ncbi:MAG: phosphate propanoyltransferase [Bacilli bacterium]|nr:phosphate propanoyltransferase [Bacilli bacterium]
MKVILGVSNRHVHLTEKTYKKLFGEKPLEVAKKLRQPEQFASNRFVTIKTEAGEINKVRVVGPLRKYNQVEISKTDSYLLKINPPIRESGNIKGSCPITIIGDSGEVHLKEGCILANRHIHITPDEIKKYNLENIKKVKIKINGKKPGILENVYLKIAKKSKLELHLDTDDSNAFNVKTGQKFEIIIEK